MRIRAATDIDSLRDIGLFQRFPRAIDIERTITFHWGYGSSMLDDLVWLGKQTPLVTKN